MTNIPITRRADEPLNDELLQRYAEESAPETTATKQMLAVVLLLVMVAVGAAILGGIVRLLARFQ